jgi:hypothetical protein
MPTLEQAINRLNHWGMLLTGRIVGTLRSEDPRSKGYRDLFQKFLILRAETTALSNLLIAKRVFTMDEFTRQLTIEVTELDRAYEKSFPGVRSGDDGLIFTSPAAAAEVMKGWPQ